jgi:hypothetical protein
MAAPRCCGDKAPESAGPERVPEAVPPAAALLAIGSAATNATKIAVFLIIDCPFPIWLMKARQSGGTKWFYATRSRDRPWGIPAIVAIAQGWMSKTSPVSHSRCTRSSPTHNRTLYFPGFLGKTSLAA